MMVDELPAAIARPLPHLRRLVVVAPHPDDEVLACGLLLARAARLGLDVTVIAVTDGEAAYPGDDPARLAACRRGEQERAVATVGVAPTGLLRLGVPDGAASAHVDRIADAIAGAISSPPVGPGTFDARVRHTDAHGDRHTLLVAPSVHDWHPDHVACGLAARAATTGWHGARWSSLFWAHHHPQGLVASRPRLLRLDGDATERSARWRAVACHRSQFRHHGGEPILTDAHVGHLQTPHEYYVEEGP